MKSGSDSGTSFPGAFPSAFVDPSSVAVVGASENQAKWGYWLARGALAGADRRQVWLVSRRATEILGHRSYPSVSDLPGTPALVVLSVPAEHVLPVVNDALAKGSRAFLGITAGLGAAAEDELAALLDRFGARMIGPNSLGLVNTTADLRLAWGHFTRGNLAIVSQSGQVGSEIAELGARSGLGISRFYSVGNQLDLTAADVLESLTRDEHTKTVALYLESFSDGTRIVEALRELRRAGKHTLVLTTGASEGSRRLARSHTGSMTSALDVVDAACRVAGALRVSTPNELVDVTRVLAATAPPAGRRVAIISDSGGQGGIAADVAAAQGLLTPALSDRLQARLRTLLPAAAAVDNPVDLAGGGEAELQVYAKVAEAVAESGEVDAIVLSGYLGRYGEDSPGVQEIQDTEFAVIDRLGQLAGGAAPVPVPLVVHSMSRSSPAVLRMRDHRIPAFDTIDAALGALGRAARLGGQPGRDLPPGRDNAASRVQGYWGAREFLMAQGIEMPCARRVTDAAELAQACTSLRAPLVLKAGWIEHKSEHGAVRTGLNQDTTAEAFTEMYDRLGPGEYVLEEQDTRPGVVEMLVGARRDPDFGPTVVVGFGGVQAELWQDVSVELAPVDRSTAANMLDRLRSSRLLDGWRGQPAVDISALIEAIVVVSELIAGDASLEEIEINPVRVGPRGALAVDGLVVPVIHHV
ncbi:acetate--CoA ligase family protein [Catenulispora rubra]|uniref:acetate--CoA ligase family protein n=1 Tax=Catenulispora rubra TaxID=280293 RepID=UPI00189280F0|nr:acetate--CoA ligase family protein [Catenulispora rubra]